MAEQNEEKLTQETQENLTEKAVAIEEQSQIAENSEQENGEKLENETEAKADADKESEIDAEKKDNKKSKKENKKENKKEAKKKGKEVEPKEMTEQDFLDKVVERRNKKRRLSFLIAVGISLVLAVVLITLASVQVCVLPKFIADGEVAVFTINYGDDLSGVPVDKNQDKFDEMLDLYEKSFTMPYMTSLFLQESGSIKETGLTISSLSTYTGANYVKVRFSQRMTVLSKDGTPYKSLTPQATDLTFDEIYFPIQTTNEFKEIVITIPVYGAYMSGSEIDQKTATLITVKVKTNAYTFTQGVERLFNLESEN